MTQRQLFGFVNDIWHMCKDMMNRSMDTEDDFDILKEFQNQIVRRYRTDNDDINQYLRRIVLDISDVVLIVKRGKSD